MDAERCSRQGLWWLGSIWATSSQACWHSVVKFDTRWANDRGKKTSVNALHFRWNEVEVRLGTYLSLSLSLVYLFFNPELVQDSTRNFSAYVLDLLKLASLAISSNSLQKHLDWVAALDFELVSQA